jgi:hypothetical protein
LERACLLSGIPIIANREHFTFGPSGFIGERLNITPSHSGIAANLSRILLGTVVFH